MTIVKQFFAAVVIAYVLIATGFIYLTVFQPEMVNLAAFQTQTTPDYDDTFCRRLNETN